MHALARNVVILVLALAGLFWARTHSFLLFHSLAELFSIIIACGIFMVAWNAIKFHANNYLVLVGLAYLFVGVLDLVHVLAYHGMMVFANHGNNLPTQLWIAARYVQALSLLLIPLLLERRVRKYLVLPVYAAATVLLLAAIFQWSVFPACFIEGSGLTPFKRNSEYLICLMVLGGMGLLWRQRRHFDRHVLLLIEGSLAILVLSELCFTLYHVPDGKWITAGHCLKILSFFLIYKAIIETALGRPYELLFRDLKQAQLEAESASRAKDHFLAVLSHELRTPLNPVLMTTSALERDESLPEHVREDIRVIRRNAELEARLIDDLLDVTRIARGKLQLAMQRTDVHLLVRQVLEICRSGIQMKQLQLRLELAAEQHLVTADPARMQQVLWNLVKNAVKFTPEGGTMAIRTWNQSSSSAGHSGPAPAGGGEPAARNPLLLIAVSDTGIGIAPELLPRIFDAFEQGGKRITQQFGGLGLGLAITKALVELHGGRIVASSAGEGQGACFMVELPAQEGAESKAGPGAVVEAASGVASRERPAAAEAAPAPCSALSTENSELAHALSILLVEDHQDTSRLMARLLRSMDFRVETAASVQSALQAATGRPFDLVISDLGLPDGSGLELMRQLKAQYGLKGICLTGYGSDQDIHSSLEAGFLEHLTKPIDLQKLQAAIERVAAKGR